MNFSKIIELFQKHKRFLVTMHVNPDSDAISSALAVAIYLKSKGKTVTVVNENNVPDNLRFFPKIDWVKKYDSEMKINYDVVVVLDSGDLSRIGKVAQLLEQKKPLVNIDHHITNDYFGTHNAVDLEASSTAELLWTLLDKTNFKINEDVALLLYMGIMTDTGSFRHDCTTAKTHRIVADLMKHSLPVANLYSRAYETMNEKDLKPFTELLNSVELILKKKVAFLEVTPAIDKKFTKNFNLRDKVFSFLNSVQGIEVIGIFTQMNRNLVKVNFRSRESIDVAKITHRFDGGGHERAAGCAIEGDLKEAKKLILGEIKKQIK